jgi:hypothetical protein
LARASLHASSSSPQHTPYNFACMAKKKTTCTPIHIHDSQRQSRHLESLRTPRTNFPNEPPPKGTLPFPASLSYYPGELRTRWGLLVDLFNWSGSNASIVGKTRITYSAAHFDVTPALCSGTLFLRQSLKILRQLTAGYDDQNPFGSQHFTTF